jgi:hypothetical protein
MSMDILCQELKKEGILIRLVFLLWDMMWEEHLYFFDGRNVEFMRAGYKGLPQGSVLYPFMRFMHNFYTGLVEACLHPLCSILQYADYLVVYISGKHIEAVRHCLQTSLTRLMTGLGTWIFHCLQTSQI